MAIGPGFVPAQLPTGQEYFKLPFNELLAGLSAKQDKFDKGLASVKGIPDLIPEAGLRTSGLRQQVLSEIDADLNPILEKLTTTGEYNPYEIEKIASKYKKDQRTSWLKQDAAMMPVANKLMAEGNFKYGLQNWNNDGVIDQLQWTGQDMTDSQGRPVGSIGEAYNFIAPENYQESFMKDIIENVIPQTGNLAPGTKIEPYIDKDGTTKYRYLNTGGKYEDFTYGRVKKLLKTPVGGGKTLQDRMYETLPTSKEGLYWIEKFKKENGRIPTVEEMSNAKLESAFGKFYYKEDPTEKAITSGGGEGSDKDPETKPIPKTVLSSLLFEGIDVDGKPVNALNINDITTNQNKYILTEFENSADDIIGLVKNYLNLPEEADVIIRPNTKNGLMEFDLNQITYNLPDDEGNSVGGWLKSSNPQAYTALQNKLNSLNADLTKKQQHLSNLQSVNDLFKSKYNVTEDLENYIPKNTLNEFESNINKTKDAAIIDYKKSKTSKIHELSTIINREGVSSKKGIAAQEELNDIEAEANKKAEEHISLYKEQFFKKHPNVPDNVKNYIKDMDGFLNNEVLFKNNTFYPLTYSADNNQAELLNSVSTILQNEATSSNVRFLNEKGNLLQKEDYRKELNKLTEEEIKKNFQGSIGVDLNSGETIVVMQGKLGDKIVTLEIPESAGIQNLYQFYNNIAGEDVKLVEAGVKADEYRKFSSLIGSSFEQNKTRAIIPESTFTLHAVPVDDGDAKKGDMIFKLPETKGLNVAYKPTDYLDLKTFTKLYNNAKLYNKDINEVIKLAVQQGLIQQVNVNLPYKDLPTNF
jgi:hypothetical protein